MDFTPGERLNLMKPVDTLSYLEDAAAGKCVLDIGCLDETALIKLDTPDWVHGRLARASRRITGVDNSDLVPEDGLLTTVGVIQRGDINSITNSVMPDAEIVIVCN